MPRRPYTAPPAARFIVKSPHYYLLTYWTLVSRSVKSSAGSAPQPQKLRVSPTPREQRRAIERLTQPRSSRGEGGVAIAGRLISRPQALLLLASAGVASAVCC